MNVPKSPFVVFAFDSTHTVLDAEQLLMDMGIDVVPVPTPGSIGGRCGIALRVPADQEERAAVYLDRADLPVIAKVSILDT